MPDDETEKNDPIDVLTATFMSVEPATLTHDSDASDNRFLVISIERQEGVVEQFGIPHHDGHLMIAELLTSMASQDCEAAKFLLTCLDKYNEDVEQNEDEKETPGDFEPDDTDADHTE